MSDTDIPVYKVDTKLGPMDFRLNSADSVQVMTHRDELGPVPNILNRMYVKISLRVQRQEGGAFTASHSDIAVNRADSNTIRNIPWATKEKAVAILSEAVTEWAKTHEFDLNVAQKRWIKRQRERIELHISQHNERIAEYQALIDELEKENRELARQL